MKSQHIIPIQKDNYKANILKAARKIITEQGWAALSMRYLAKAINYTAPVFYNYFPAKDDLVSALVEIGYSLLIRKIKEARKKQEKPGQQWNQMWLAYWEFGRSEKALYQAMFGVGVKSPISNAIPNGIAKLAQVFKNRSFKQQWAAVHGLVSLQFTSAKIPDELGRVILNDTLKIFQKDANTNSKAAKPGVPALIC